MLRFVTAFAVGAMIVAASCIASGADARPGHSGGGVSFGTRSGGAAFSANAGGGRFAASAGGGSFSARAAAPAQRSAAVASFRAVAPAGIIRSAGFRAGQSREHFVRFSGEHRRHNYFRGYGYVAAFGSVPLVSYGYASSYNSCRWLKARYEDTGLRKWRLRYEDCLAGDDN